MADRLLSLCDVTVDLDGHGRGVRGVRLELEAGEIGIVCGRRNAGKSTLLRLAGGMLEPDEGTVLFRGDDLYALCDRERSRLLAREIAWSCRAGPGAMQLRVLDYVGLPLVAGRRVSNGERVRLARDALRRLDVGRCARLRWVELSGWQRVCVELAQAIVRGPCLLLVDDLIDGLSMSGAREAIRAIRSVCEQDGVGVLITSDDLELGVLADRLWRIEDGEIREMIGPVSDVEGAPVVSIAGRRARRAEL